jgi:hypothetical protein
MFLTIAEDRSRTEGGEITLKKTNLWPKEKLKKHNNNNYEHRCKIIAYLPNDKNSEPCRALYDNTGFCFSTLADNNDRQKCKTIQRAFCPCPRAAMKDGYVLDANF